MIYTADEVATYLDVHVNTVYNEMKRGRLGFTRVGGKRKVSEPQLLAYLEQQSTDPWQNDDTRKSVGTGSVRSRVHHPGTDAPTTNGLDARTGHHLVQRMKRRRKSG